MVCDSQHANITVVYEDGEEMRPISSGQIFLCGMTKERPKLTSALISSRQDESLSNPPYILHLRAMGMLKRWVVFITTTSLTFLPFMSTD